MRIIRLGLMASMVLFPLISLAQTAPQAPDSWKAFQKQEILKIDAFYNQMKADRAALIDSDPQVKAYYQQIRQFAQAHYTAFRAAALAKKNSSNPTQP